METKKYFQEGRFGIWVPHTRIQESLRIEKWVLRQFNWRDKLILDIGVGAGRFSLATAKKGGEVIALDIYPKTIQLVKGIIAKHHLNNKISLLIADAERLPFRHEVFDIIICMSTLMHLPNPETASSEMWRTLKKEKFAIVHANNKFSLFHFKHVLSNIASKIYHFITRTPLQKQTPHYWACSLYTFQNYLLKAGFKIRKKESHNIFKYRMVITVQKS